MSYKHVAGLCKVIGHVKVAGEGDLYEPALYIFNETAARFRGKSFIVALSAMWKYVQPFLHRSDPKLIEKDFQKFEATSEKVQALRRRLSFGLELVTPQKVQEANRDMEALIFADALYRSNRILYMTGYNLAHLMQMFEIPPNPQAACQLLLFIENSLEALKNAKPVDPETQFTAGGYEVFIGSDKVASGDWKIPESELVEERYEIETPQG